MKPRVFISSTYYDLKYVRENLEKLLDEMNFEPVLFESNKVTFEHGKPLDIACFNEVKTCHMMVLVVGGRYGSIISDPNSQVEKDIYDKEYISITRREFETAANANIPAYIFIDKNVYSEYHTYKINRKFYDDALKKGTFKFFYVDSVNVFKFIDLLNANAIKSFEKNEEIEQYLKDQISGMFYLYLESLKSGSRQEEIYDTVSELKNLIKSMSQMVNAVGKSVITDPNSLHEVIIKQLEILISFYTDKFFTECNLNVVNEPYNDHLIKGVVDILYKKVLPNRDFWIEYTGENKEEVLGKINELFKGITPSFSFSNFDFWLIDDFREKISPLLSDVQYEKKFLDAMAIIIDRLIRYEQNNNSPN